MSFIVSTDAASDLDYDYVQANDIRIISMRYTMIEDDKETECVFGNNESGITISEFYSKIREGAQAKTALINTFSHKEYFLKLLEENSNILHVPLSSALSGTAQCAIEAAEEIMREKKDVNIAVVNFNGASMGQGLFVDYMVRLRDEGKTLEEAAQWGNTNKLNFCHYFTVDDLGHLRRGGRVSGVAAFIGSLIKIKPLLHVNNEGKLIAIGKNIGRKKALLNLVEKMRLLTDGEKQRVFISHGDCLSDAKYVAERITELFGIDDIRIGYIGPIIGAHSGPGTVALFFMGKNR